MPKQKTWRGLMTLSGALLALSIAATPVVSSYRTNIDSYLGTVSKKIVTKEASESHDELYTYKSDYSSTKDLVTAIKTLAENTEAEGIVLLKNKNDSALPLTSTEIGKTTLLGFSSYFPVLGGDMGSSLTSNSGTDADTVESLYDACKGKGFTLNDTVKDVYMSNMDAFKTIVNKWGQKIPYFHITAPATSGTFSSKELSPTALDGLSTDWRASVSTNNTVIVTLARSASENGSYLPGTDGVDSSQNLNQTDPLGLSDDERNLIKGAKELAGTNGKVVVLLNNASALEVQELQDSDDVDAMLEIGLPGGYGLNAVADVLKGAVNPSGRLADTYAVKNSVAPSAQNYGDLQWTNADNTYYINDALVESESIYDGYYYYETRYADCVLGQGNANSTKGSSDGKAWSYANEVTYPFGYGLSYTTFEQTLENVEVDVNKREVTATVKVKNTGKVPGKDAVQLYVSLPWEKGQVEKSAIQLLDYGKTNELAAGAEETVTIKANLENMASWDSEAENALGTKGNYILDAGDYLFSIGDSHEALNNVLAYKGKTKSANGMTADGNKDNVKSKSLAQTSLDTTKNGTKLENHLSDMDLNTYDGFKDTVTYLKRGDWDGTFPKTYKNLTASDAMIKTMKNDLVEVAPDNEEKPVFGEKNGLTLADLKGVKDLSDPRWESLMNQITLEECVTELAFGGTSTKVVDSIINPEVIQNDGPNGIYSYNLGKYASTTAEDNNGDEYKVEETDKNAGFKMGVMPSETVMAQTFSKKMANDYGKVAGNYSLWSNLTIWWGIGTNLHRTPYNARNHEYYSEDPVLTAGQGNEVCQGALEYGLLAAPKHLAFNDTEINRSGVAVFMTEQKARQLELRGTQSIVENGALAVMTAFNRVGVTASNSHYGLMIDILREEWGFQGLISEDFIQNAIYSSPKEAAHCGVTMTCNTGEHTKEAFEKKWDFLKLDDIAKDNSLAAEFKQAMTWQFYAIANSNAMDGVSSSSEVVNVRTWYDNVLLAAQIVFGLATAGCIAMYVLNYLKANKEEK